MFRPGMGELILVFGVLVLMFGAKKLPSLGQALGESIKNFKKGIDHPDEKKAVDSAPKTPEQLAAEGRSTVKDVDRPS
jgi:sec-independent protein translocase protein TatA